jgi:LPXTG-motif cell wall-anchored protein
VEFVSLRVQKPSAQHTLRRTSRSRAAAISGALLAAVLSVGSFTGLALAEDGGDSTGPQSAESTQSGQQAAPSPSASASTGTGSAATALRAAQGTALSCAAGDFYTITENGEVSKVTSSGNTPDANAASADIDFGTGTFNGLAIGADGQTAYAFDRAYGNGGRQIAIYEWTAESGTSARVWNGTLPSGSGVANASLIAGGVSPTDPDGSYYFGGFITVYTDTEQQARFQVLKFDGTDVTLVGSVLVYQAREIAGGNGDLAFDANGNLYILWNDGKGTSRIVPVSAAQLANPDGDEIHAGDTATLNSQSGVQYNGIAFNSTGAAFVQYSGDQTRVGAINPDTGEYVSSPQTIALSGLSGVGVDLASCQIPPTFQKLQKNVTDRVADTDQFRLTITREGQDDPSATGQTAGTDTGLQTDPTEVAGPVIAEVGASYLLEETGAGEPAADLATYTSSLVCVDTAHLNASVPVTPVEGSTTKYRVTVDDGAALECTFTNTPRRGSLTLTKVVDNRYGGTAGANDFDLTATPSGGQELGFTSGETKDVDPGSYTIGETLRPGYQQESLVCTADGEDLTVTGSAVAVVDGQDVECTLTNQDLPGSLTWTKVDEGGNALAGSEWTLIGPGGQGSVTVADCAADKAEECAGPDTDPAAGAFSVGGLAWGDYTLTEAKAPTGYVRSDAEHAFTIEPGSDGTNLAVDLGALTNEQATPPTLPLTGGMSTDAFLLGGGGLLAAAGAGWLIHRRRSLRA